MNKQTQFNFRIWSTSALFSAVLFTSAALGKDDIVIGDAFTIDNFGESVNTSGERQAKPSCQIVISSDSGAPSMVCEGTDTRGNNISCTSDQPPFAGAILAFSANKTELLENLGEPEAKCERL